MNNKEVWKDVKNYEGIYQVSNLGEIKSLNYNNTKVAKVLKGGIDGGGYRIHIFCNKGTRKTIKAHRVILSAFLDMPKDKTQVNHKDGDKLNNSLDNLEWVNQSENQIHAFATGLQKKLWGKDNPAFGKEPKHKGVTATQEVRATNGNQKGNSSKYLGVYFHKASSKYMARIMHLGKYKYLGLFKCEVAASLAYQKELKNITILADKLTK